MIVCHCNVLTDKQILATLADEPLTMPRSPVQVYKCLGCAPNCGRCLTAVRALLQKARANSACAVGCATCPAQHVQVANDQVGRFALVAAE
jgi:bacterioferritin-associated ferredoxin